MLLNLLGILVMIAGLLIIPFGLPGLWLMIAVLAVAAFGDTVSWFTLAALVLLGLVAELLEFLSVQRLSARHGGSNKAFWGAIAGGLVGAILGAPVPILGPLVGGVVGTFAGATLVTAMEQRDLGPAAVRVGWGAALGRAVAVAIKIAAAVVILVVGAWALVF